ncbi:MAG: restriction endonuclease [Lachnospiraceae bacterium]|nr:restriction endonuclease [Lachnospiraceae bacterium]
MEVQFSDLENAPLIVDCIYKGGKAGNKSDEVLPKLLPKCGNSSGFRKVGRKDKPGEMAYVVLYTSMSELEWPDYLDKETGIFRYYGDNRTPGKNITDTKQGGNKLLEKVFAILNSGMGLEDIPPFLVFKKVGTGKDIQFLGLAVPGNPKISPDRDLVAFWRTLDDNRFQNYEAHFTILNTGDKPISKEWLRSLIEDHDNSLELAPPAWKKFVRKGRNGIEALKAPQILKIPSKYDQLQSDIEGRHCLQRIRDYYKQNPQGFEACARDLIYKMDNHFVDFTLTRPWRDGGRDAIGYFEISSSGKANRPLKIDCALEAKCYAEKNPVKVREMSRLISRIRYRQFGIMVTTSYVHDQAYKEVVEDEHPILIVTASDIAAILRQNAIYSTDVDLWLNDIRESDNRFAAYSKSYAQIVNNMEK